MKCPGQDSRYWKADAVMDVKCPKCGHEVEFFKDDTTRRCKHCGHKFLNPGMDFGCASYCKFAGQCIGNLPPELIAQKENLLKDRVAIEMKRYFKTDFKRIGHASRVARYAEQIGREEQGNLAIILIAAYLHDIGIKEAERKHQSTAARFQEQEGPPIAREILTQLGAKEEIITEVMDIIGHHHHPGPSESIDFKCVYDADLLVNLEEKKREEPMDLTKWAEVARKSFLTKSGKALAEKKLLASE
ncbi:MAG: HD domain-containing protein [Deltaproteobacteria bacterium]|nr:HD domain-containing protein [Deltaproteobacteria bacterium]